MRTEKARKQKPGRAMTTSAFQTRKMGRRMVSQMLSNHARESCVVALKGQLGSGKTTFAQGVARELGVREKVLSPTFVILKSYNVLNTKYDKRMLYHIDCYRIEHSKEIVELGWHDIIADSKNIILIEWPEHIQDILPENTIIITFQATGENKRTIVVE